MTESTETEAFTHLVERIDPQAKLIDSWELAGGVSAEVTALEIGRADGTTETLVVRRHGTADLASNPQVAADEFKLLTLLHSVGIAVPGPIMVDATGELLGSPCLVVEYVEGDTDDAPKDQTALIDALVEKLAQIHSLDAKPFTFLGQRRPRLLAKIAEYVAQPDPTPRMGRISAVLTAMKDLPQRNASVLLHGDYWVGNVLWRDDQIAAIIDWEDAAIGDPMSDLATARLELLWALGADAMQAFTRGYQQAMPDVDLTDLPYWDVASALHDPDEIARWVGETRGQVMVAWQAWFVTQALEAIG